METETALQNGGGSQTGYSRWGDYSAMRVDPSDDCTFWYANEYYPQSSSGNWHTYIGSFKFADCGAQSSADFTVAESPSPLTIAAGATSGSAASVTVSSTNGFTSAVTLSSTCSAPITCTFGTNPVIPPANSSASTTLTVSVAVGTTPGTYANTITGTAGNLVHSTGVTVTVPVPPDFSIGESPSPLTIAAGSNSGSAASVTVTSLAGFNSAVTLSATCAAPLTCSFGTNPVTPAAKLPAKSVLTVGVAADAAAGTYTGIITGTAGALAHSAKVTISVPPADFSLAATATSLTVARGTNVTDAITLSSTGSSSVKLSLQGLPANSSASFTPNPVDSNSSSVLKLHANIAAVPGTYAVTLIGKNTAYTHSIPMTVTIQ
jgi:hypothetical protein